LRRHDQYLRQVVKRRTAASSKLSSAIAVRSAKRQSFTVSGTVFGADTIAVNNRSISMFTAAVNYKFGRWGY
jgi:hypothetical protein